MSALQPGSNPDILRLPRSKVAIVGDLILDRYVFGDASRISPEAPIQVLDVREERYDLGGAANVAEKVASLDSEPLLFGVTGEDAEGRELARLLRKAGIGVSGAVAEPGRPTTIKTRFLAKAQQVLRVDRESRAALAEATKRALLRGVRSALRSARALVLDDYAKGVLTRPAVSECIRMARERGVPIIVDPKDRDFTKYRGCTVITPNRKEAEEATGVHICDDATLHRAAGRIFAATAARAAIVTLDKDGMAVLRRRNGSRLDCAVIPTRARAVFDPTGAGDAVTAVLAVCLAAGMPLEEAAKAANAAAGLIVEQVGVGRLSQDALRRAMMTEHFSSAAKILERRDIVPLMDRLRREKKKVVFTNGCFDLMHAGHVTLLSKARSFGDILILAINSDASIARLKGPNRPVLDQDERLRLLASLSCVDYVTVFGEPTPKRLLRMIKPDILVKGGDNTRTTAVGWDIVAAYGGRVEIVPLIGGISTTKLVERIRAGRG